MALLIFIWMGSQEIQAEETMEGTALESWSSWNKRLLLETGRRNWGLFCKDVWNHWSKPLVSQMLEGLGLVWYSATCVKTHGSGRWCQSCTARSSKIRTMLEARCCWKSVKELSKGRIVYEVNKNRNFSYYWNFSRPQGTRFSSIFGIWLTWIYRPDSVELMEFIINLEVKDTKLRFS